jgi:hypothetical protein
VTVLRAVSKTGPLESTAKSRRNVVAIEILVDVSNDNMLSSLSMDTRREKQKKRERATKDLCSLSVYRFPRSIHQKMKIRAAKEGKTMKDVMIEACEQYLKGR